MKCPHCGSDNPNNAKYCNLCLKSFQTPAEIELAQEIQQKENAKPDKPQFSLGKLILVIAISFGIALAVFLGIKTIRKSAGNDFLSGLTGVSTSKSGVRVKKVIDGKTVEGYVGHVPKDFPTYLLYQGAKIKISQRVTDPAGKISFLVMSETSDSSKKIIDFYKQNLEAKGFEITLPPAEAPQDIGLLSFSKESAKGKISISANEKVASINLTYVVILE